MFERNNFCDIFQFNFNFKRSNESSERTGRIGLISSLCLDKYSIKPGGLFRFNV